MLRYKNIANVTIEIDLNNGYSVLVMARRNNEENTYSVTLYLKNNKYNINHFDLIEDYQNIKFNSNNKAIKADITSAVAKLLDEGFFDKYIRRFVYEQKCFELGNESLEKERIGK